jgi:4-alpha-glucanotransferase
MKKINFIFCVHNHQPVGNFDHIFEEAYQKSYKPFLDVVSAHPSIKISYHNTGILYDWFEEKHPDFLEKISRMTNSGQLELLTSGYYEPILAIIPDNDKVGQIQKHKEYLKKRFNYDAGGLWLAERVWEQHIVKQIAEAGIRYVVIDDTHFKYAGFKDSDLKGYFRTEEQGFMLHIFPIKKKLRYTIPFQPIPDTFQYLSEIATEDGLDIAVCADDGEKFGLWPETYNTVYTEKWLDNFFIELEQNLDWINVIHFRDAMDNINPQGLVYLPTSSYSEMMHWALPSAESFIEYDQFCLQLKKNNLFEANNQFVRGGYWRNFFVKYPEANHMHKKMMRVTQKYEQITTKKEYPEILDKIWKGQCNCPYWHGVFGGIYLTNLRYPIYKSLIEAEAMIDKINRKNDISVEVMDFDFDGSNEVLVETSKFNVIYSLKNGGALYELDIKGINTNLLDILSRREEGYHKKLTDPNYESSEKSKIRFREGGLENLLFYDWYRHGSFIDHFFGDNVTLDQVYRSQYPEMGDFVNQPYKHEVVRIKDDVEVTFSRNGHIWYNGVHIPLRVKKCFKFNQTSDEVITKYTIEKINDLESIHLKFGVELNFALLAGEAPDRYYVFPDKEIENKNLNSMGEVQNCNSFELYDEWQKMKIQVKMDKNANIMRFPLETVSLSEYGFERIYQSSVVIPYFDIELQDKFCFTITQKISLL